MYNIIVEGSDRMAVADKVKALLKLKSRDNAQLAGYLNISKQALSNKLYRDSFSAEDLIKIADFLGCNLSFIISDTQKINLEISDLKSDTPDAKDGE